MLTVGPRAPPDAPQNPQARIARTCKPKCRRAAHAHAILFLRAFSLVADAYAIRARPLLSPCRPFCRPFGVRAPQRQRSQSFALLFVSAFVQGSRACASAQLSSLRPIFGRLLHLGATPRDACRRASHLSSDDPMPALTACKRALCPEASEPSSAQIKPGTGGPQTGALGARAPSTRGGTPAGAASRSTMSGVGVSSGRARAESGPVKKAAKRTAPPPPSSTTPVPCPRCGSEATKFCYYNNYDPQQPRYYCKVRRLRRPPDPRCHCVRRALVSSRLRCLRVC